MIKEELQVPIYMTLLLPHSHALTFLHLFHGTHPLDAFSNIQPIEFLLDLPPYVPSLLSNVYFKCILTNSLKFISLWNFNTITLENPQTLKTPSQCILIIFITSVDEKIDSKTPLCLFTPVSIGPSELLSFSFMSQEEALIPIPVAPAQILGQS